MPNPCKDHLNPSNSPMCDVISREWKTIREMKPMKNKTDKPPFIVSTVKQPIWYQPLPPPPPSKYLRRNRLARTVEPLQQFHNDGNVPALPSLVTAQGLIDLDDTPVFPNDILEHNATDDVALSETDNSGGNEQNITVDVIPETENSGGNEQNITVDVGLLNAGDSEGNSTFEITSTTDEIPVVDAHEPTERRLEFEISETENVNSLIDSTIELENADQTKSNTWLSPLSEVSEEYSSAISSDLDGSTLLPNNLFAENSTLSYDELENSTLSYNESESNGKFELEDITNEQPAASPVNLLENVFGAFKFMLNDEMAGSFAYESRKTLNSELVALQNKYHQWTDMLRTETNIPNDVTADINSLIGKIHLLTTGKLAQYRTLLDKYENSDTQPPVLENDVRGFWDLAYIEIEDLNQLFEQLNFLKQNNWIERPEMLVSQLKSESSNGGLLPAKKRINTAASKIKSIISAARKQFLNDKQEELNVDIISEDTAEVKPVRRSVRLLEKQLNSSAGCSRFRQVQNVPQTPEVDFLEDNSKKMKSSAKKVSFAVGFMDKENTTPTPNKKYVCTPLRKSGRISTPTRCVKCDNSYSPH